MSKSSNTINRHLTLIPKNNKKDTIVYTGVCQGLFHFKEKMIEHPYINPSRRKSQFREINLSSFRALLRDGPIIERRHTNQK